VAAVKGLPPQQQLVLCAAANLIGDSCAAAATPGGQTPFKGTPAARRLSLGSCPSPLSANKVCSCCLLPAVSCILERRSGLEKRQPMQGCVLCAFMLEMS
jgi:hypothetical protein